MFNPLFHLKMSHTKEYMHQYWLAHKEQEKARVADWREKNRDRYNEQARKYANRYKLCNREKILEKNRRYYWRNKQKLNEKHRIYYSQNKEKILRQYQAIVAAKKTYFIELRGNRCSRCNNTFPLVCYDFHHIDPSTKKENTIDWNQEDNLLKEEMNKCSVLCANCHRIVHWGEKNGGV